MIETYGFRISRFCVIHVHSKSKVCLLVLHKILFFLLKKVILSIQCDMIGHHAIPRTKLSDLDPFQNNDLALRDTVSFPILI